MAAATLWKRARRTFVTESSEVEEHDHEAADMTTTTTAAVAAICSSVEGSNDKTDGGGAQQVDEEEGTVPTPPQAPATTSTATATATATAAAATAAAASLVVPAVYLRGAAALATAAGQGRHQQSSPPPLPPLPVPQPGDLVAWLPPPTAAHNENKREAQEAQEQEQPPRQPLPPAEGGWWEQTLTLSRYAPRLSSAGACGGDGAPSYAQAGPAVPLGVAVHDGRWMAHSGDEGEDAVVYLCDPPTDPATEGTLLVLRSPALAEDVPRILARAVAYRCARLELIQQPARLALALRSAATAANAGYACWATSVPGTHLRTPIERGPLFHHAVDTGEGTVIHYSGGEVRLDPLYVLLVGPEALAPHRLTAVDAAGRPATEAEVLAVLARATSRLGERRYCAIANNCEHMARWSTGRRHVSAQVQATSLAVGSVVGSLGALLLGAASAPVWALPVLGVSGAAVGSAVTYGAVASATVKPLREVTATAAAAAAVAVMDAGGGGVVDLTGVSEEVGPGAKQEQGKEDAKQDQGKEEDEREEEEGDFVVVDPRKTHDAAAAVAAGVGR